MLTRTDLRALYSCFLAKAQASEIADQWVMTQKYGSYGEWKDSDSSMSNLTGNHSLPTPSFEFGSRALSAASTSESDEDQGGQLNDITGFMDRAGSNFELRGA